MRYHMPKKNEVILNKLLTLAEGDLELVCMAMRKSKPGEIPTLKDVVAYINEHSEKQK